MKKHPKVWRDLACKTCAGTGRLQSKGIPVRGTACACPKCNGTGNGGKWSAVPNK